MSSNRKNKTSSGRSPREENKKRKKEKKGESLFGQSIPGLEGITLDENDPEMARELARLGIIFLLNR